MGFNYPNYSLIQTLLQFPENKEVQITEGLLCNQIPLNLACYGVVSLTGQEANRCRLLASVVANQYDNFMLEVFILAENLLVGL